MTSSPAVPSPYGPSAPWDLATAPAVPVARPRLAPVAAALPYLNRIDDRRIYSNFGPLVNELEERLAARFGQPAGAVVTCSNGTVGITLALLAAAPTPGGLCLTPAWTFAATGHAVLAAGLTPYIVDVDPETGALTPDIAEAALRQASGEVVAVLPVAPFGLPPARHAWDRFTARTGVAVVIDGAAAFDGLLAGPAPAVVSLHATKVLGVGEGGFIVSTEVERIAELRRRTNFGFHGDRSAAVMATNGKISEYAAAFGLAALDLWPLMRAEYLTILQCYHAALEDAPRVRIAEGLGAQWVCSTFNVETPTPEAAARIEAALAAGGVATRRWYGRGLHAHPAFSTAPRLPTPVTDRLAACTVGLPCWPGLEPEAILRIAEVVREVTGSAAASDAPAAGRAAA